MNPQLIVSILALVALFSLVIVLSRADSTRETIIAANSSIGRHAAGLITFFSEGAITSRYLIVKKGTASDEIQVCGATDSPLGFINDTTEADRDPSSVILPGSHDHTIMGVPVVDITAGDDLYTAAGGGVTNVPVPGCFHVGKAVSDGDADASNPLVEIDPVGFGMAYQAKTLAFCATVALVGGAASEALTISGLLATDIPVVTITDNLANENVSLLEAKPTADTLTLLFNEDPTAGVKVSYAIYR